MMTLKPVPLYLRRYAFLAVLILMLGFYNTLQPTTALAAGPEIVSTFNSLGITWKPADASAARTANVQYRTAGSSAWQDGLPLWFDHNRQEYRGSIVQLTPGVTYQVRLSLENTSTSAETEATTWNESFPVAKTVYLPSTSSKMLVIDESGSPNGYILYTHKPGQSATIDVDNKDDASLIIRGSYIIIRDLTLKGGQQYGLQIRDDAHDIVIEGNDISNWGDVAEDGWAYGKDGGIDIPSTSHSARIIIQGNKIHHPRYDSNNWDEPRPVYNGNPHPIGAHGIRVQGTGSNFVIRYNDIYSDDEHYFQDCIGGGTFPDGDTDIYGNYIERCWDDGIQSEGGNKNVRIWGNYIDKTYIALAIAPIDVGPLYIWRNISNQHNFSTTKFTGSFIKTGVPNSDVTTNGRAYVFHNTMLQPKIPGEIEPVGASNGIGNGPSEYVVTRNNIFFVSGRGGNKSINNSLSDTNDFDYDLYNAGLKTYDGAESHGINKAPTYNSTNGAGEFYLDASSAGFSKGITIPNFNDKFTGTKPDMGAHEAGTAPMKFGVEAYTLPDPINDPTPEPTDEPTPEPTDEPTPEPTDEPTSEPTDEPTPAPTNTPTPAPTSTPDTPLTLRLTMPDAVSQGDTFAVLVEADVLDADMGIYGAQFEIDYDPSLLVVSNLKINSALSLAVMNRIDNTLGKVQIAASRQGDAPELTGNVVLLSFDAKAIGSSGAAQLTLNNVKLSNRAAFPLDVTSRNGTVIIGTGPTPEPTGTPDPIETPTPQPTDDPTPNPTDEPTPDPTNTPTPTPTDSPLLATLYGMVELPGRSAGLLDDTQVTLVDKGISTTTQPDGTFAIINIAPGTYDALTANAPGYLSATCTDVIVSIPETVLQTASLLSGDVTNDDLVDIADATVIGASFGQQSENLTADINRDNIIDIFDLVLVSINFGQEGGQPWLCNNQLAESVSN
ncbi:MAG: hypothetical protein KDJ52_04840 [Anaerolineae bacterium]|nr:hypothetical protein [Anaerolineae bacterium]